MSTKSKSDFVRTSDVKHRPIIIKRVSESSQGADSTSSSFAQNARFSAEQSPGSVTLCKPPLEKTSDKNDTSVSKSSELQAELNQVKADLKKANQKLTLLEKQKAKALKQAKKARKSSEEANEKLKEALAAKKRAERTQAELERAYTEGAFKKLEEKCQKRLEELKKEHAVDLTALSLSNQELEKTKRELVITCNERNQALSHMNVVSKLAGVHEKKVKDLSAELVRLKDVFDAMMRVETTENEKLVSELKSKLEEKEDVLLKIKFELENAKLAEFYARMNSSTTFDQKHLFSSDLLLANTRLHESLREKENELRKNRLEAEEGLREKENELRKNRLEAEELMKKEVALSVKVEVLSSLLEEALVKTKQVDELNSYEKEYDVLPSWTGFVHVNEEHVELNDAHEKTENEDLSEVDIQMWENCEIDELSKLDFQKKKKKKALFSKIGSLLKN